MPDMDTGYSTAEVGAISAQEITGFVPTQQPQFSPHQQHDSFQQQPQQQQQQFMSGGPVPGDGATAAGNNNPLNLGLGFLRGLGLERKTNRDGQPPKRRGPKPDSKPALTRRQELNRQAQRTHRQRKEVYIKSLEDQVMQLKELFALQVQERSVVDEENRKLRELLHFHGIQAPSELLSQLAQQQQQQQQQQQTAADGAFSSNFSTSDGGLGPGASDYATPSSYHASGSESGVPVGPGSAVSASSNGTTLHQAQQHHHQYQQQLQMHHQHQHAPEQLIQGNPEENQLGIDFVLALEAFCRDHQQFLCVRSSQSVESAEPVASGHALMLSCPPASHIQQNPGDTYPHQAPPLPTASLASLLQSAQKLPWVGDGEVTPIMALHMIQKDPRYTSMLVREFTAVRLELEEKTRCYGFGAVLEEFEVRDALENVFSGRIPKSSGQQST